MASALMQRDRIASRLGKSFNGARKLYEVCGYPKVLKFEDYLTKYDRQDVAARIVDAPCTTTWKNPPNVTETEDNTNETEFEKQWKRLVKKRRIFHYLERIDKLSGIGRFGVLVIGVKGGAKLSDPLEDGSLKGPDDIIYLAPYMEGNVYISEWEIDPSNERFGKPKVYQIDMSSDIVGAVTCLQQTLVHHTRVIHIAEGLMEDEILGEPRLKKVFNRLNDLEKLAGGGAEMFWQGAFGGLHADTKEGFTLDPNDAATLTDELEEYTHGLRRFIRTSGIDLNRIPVSLGDPKPVFDIIISLISGKTRIPKRILTGSEQGELASSQDENNWFGYIKERRVNYAEPMILRQFIDWCIDKGALPEPKVSRDDYLVEWPALYEMSDMDKADIALKKTQAIKEFAPPGATDVVVPVAEFRELILGMDAEPDDKYAPKEEPLLPEDDPNVQDQFDQSKGVGLIDKTKRAVQGVTGNIRDMIENLIVLLRRDREGEDSDDGEYHTIVNFNPSHGKDGKFTSGGGDSGGVYTEFTSDGGASFGETMSSEWESSLTESEVAGIKSYVNQSVLINGYMREGDSYFDKFGSSSGNLSKITKENAGNIKSALSKGEISKNIVVYRGMSSDVIQRSGIKKGSIVSDKGFMSTTFDKVMAKEYAGNKYTGDKGAVVKIKVKKGTKGQYITKTVNGYSGGSGSEVLLQHGTKMKVTKIKKGKDGVTNVEMEVI